VFLQEIEFDEFETTKTKVTISTMHKAKGKEFQSVYMMVENIFIRNDYDRRLLYVAMTRAKENLFIHTQDRCFDSREPLATEVLSMTQKGETIGVLSTPNGGKTRLSDKICQKESQGYTLYPEGTIEYVVRWEKPQSTQHYDQILCLVRMDQDPLKTLLSQPIV